MARGWGVALLVAALVLSVGACSRRRTQAARGLAYAPTATYPRYQCFPECSPGYSCERGVCIRPCNPMCAAGWACSDGTCMPMCNPPCAPGYHCGATRTCEPGPARPARMAEPTQEWLPAPPEPATTTPAPTTSTTTTVTSGGASP